MITGSVHANREAVISLVVRGPGGEDRTVSAVVDTGFNGFLTLPPRIITALRLSRLGLARVRLADGREQFLQIYEAAVIWDGQSRIVEVDSADTDALLGMALLDGYALRIEVTNGGAVEVNKLP